MVKKKLKSRIILISIFSLFLILLVVGALVFLHFNKELSNLSDTSEDGLATLSATLYNSNGQIIQSGTQSFINGQQATHISFKVYASNLVGNVDLTNIQVVSPNSNLGNSFDNNGNPPSIPSLLKTQSNIFLGTTANTCTLNADCDTKEECVDTNADTILDKCLIPLSQYEVLTQPTIFSLNIKADYNDALGNPQQQISDLLSVFYTIQSDLEGSLVGDIPLDSNFNDIKGGITGTPFNGATLTADIYNYAKFNGGNQYAELTDRNEYSPITTGQISISFWMRPEFFDFIGVDAGFVNLLGKGQYGSPNQMEWYFRMYNSTAVDGVSRSKRTSFYMFNSAGGIGVGSYFQDNLVLNEWIHVVGVANGTHTKIYKNGILRDTDKYEGTIITTNTNAPLRIGTVTKDARNYFNGSIDDIRIYNKELTLQEIQQIYNSR